MKAIFLEMQKEIDNMQSIHESIHTDSESVNFSEIFDQIEAKANEKFKNQKEMLKEEYQGAATWASQMIHNLKIKNSFGHDFGSRKNPNLEIIWDPKVQNDNFWEIKENNANQENRDFLRTENSNTTKIEPRNIESHKESTNYSLDFVKTNKSYHFQKKEKINSKISDIQNQVVIIKQDNSLVEKKFSGDHQNFSKIVKNSSTKTIKKELKKSNLMSKNKMIEPKKCISKKSEDMIKNPKLSQSLIRFDNQKVKI